MPESEALTTSNTEKLLLTQGEQSRIYWRLDRLENARGPLKRSPIQVLEEEPKRVGSRWAACGVVPSVAPSTKSHETPART